jgi:uncharacterized protein (DUF1697 family)
VTTGPGSKYVALLKGINVGRNQRVAMTALRELLIGLGYNSVRTHLQSGNALFASRSGDPAGLAREIEKAIDSTLGLRIRCLVRTQDELWAVIRGNPLQNEATDGSRMLVLFLSESPDVTLLAEHDPRELGPDQIRLVEREIYQWCPNGILAAPNLSAFVEKYLKVTVTNRNWNTVTRLGALLDEA